MNDDRDNTDGIIQGPTGNEPYNLRLEYWKTSALVKSWSKG